jgi:hypothetical protein
MQISLWLNTSSSKHMKVLANFNNCMVEASWNVMAHAQKPDFVFRRNGRFHLNRRGRQFSRLLTAEVSSSTSIVGSNAGYAMFRGSVKGTGYTLHSPVFPSLPLPCVTVCHHVSTGVYKMLLIHNCSLSLSTREGTQYVLVTKVGGSCSRCGRDGKVKNQVLPAIEPQSFIPWPTFYYVNYPRWQCIIISGIRQFSRSLSMKN